jgi:AcrR family transcriptional regulator
MVTTSLRAAELGSAAQRERRRRIVRVTVTLASEGGFDAVQMRTVAERADVALGTLYRYFPSKIHLLVSVLADRFETAQLALDPMTLTGPGAEERVTHVLGGATELLQEEPRLTEALTRAFMFADASVAAEIHLVGLHVVTLLLKAIHGPSYVERAKPTAEEIAIVRVVGDVWFAALVAWVTGRATPEDVTASVRTAVHLLLR